MNRWLMAVVLGLTVVGCAEGVEDPQPAPPPVREHKQPPTQTLAGTLPEESPDPITALGVDAPDLPPHELPVPPTPGGE